jgi:hypothetical protein
VDADTFVEVAGFLGAKVTVVAILVASAFWWIVGLRAPRIVVRTAL